MSTISLCMIVKDEEFHLEECLESARPFVDQIAVVDTGSTDRTPRIVERLADVSANFTWIDDFSAARNASLELATSDWILVLDADERIDPQGYESIRNAVENEDVDGYLLEHFNYNTEPGRHRFPAPADNPYTKGFAWYSVVPILRLFRRHRDIRFRGPIHELVDRSMAPGRIATLGVPIHHYMHGNPAHPRRERVLRYLEMMDKELALNPSGRLYGVAGASALYTAHDYEKAAHYLLRAAEYGYRMERSLEGAAEASYLAGRREQAQRIYQEVYGMGHRSPSMCVNMANLALRRGEHERAVSLLEETLELGGLGADKARLVRNNIAALKSAAAAGGAGG